MNSRRASLPCLFALAFALSCTRADKGNDATQRDPSQVEDAAPQAKDGAAAPSDPAADASPADARAETGAQTGEAEAPAEDEPEDEPEDEDVYTNELSEDLDGDGSADKATVRCSAIADSIDTKVEVRVGEAEAVVEANISELIGCYLEAEAHRAPGKQLWVTVDEHEEVGPDNSYLFAYRAGKLEEIWASSEELSVNEDGTWETSTSDCDEDSHTLTTTVTVYRWTGSDVKERERKEVEKVDPGDCEFDDP